MPQRHTTAGRATFSRPSNRMLGVLLAEVYCNCGAPATISVPRDKPRHGREPGMWDGPHQYWHFCSFCAGYLGHVIPEEEEKVKVPKKKRVKKPAKVKTKIKAW